MAEQQETGEERFRAAVQARLGPERVDPAIVAALADGVVQAEHAVAAEVRLPGQSSLNVRLGKFVVRDDDLPLFESLGAVAAAVTAAMSTAGVATPLIVTAVVSLARLCWTLWRKGVLLTDDQMMVLGVLQTSGPSTLDEVLARIRARAPAMPVERVTATLRSLGEIELSSGAILRLASADSANLWRSHPI